MTIDLFRAGVLVLALMGSDPESAENVGDAVTEKETESSKMLRIKPHKIGEVI